MKEHGALLVKPALLRLLVFQPDRGQLFSGDGAVNEARTQFTPDPTELREARVTSPSNCPRKRDGDPGGAGLRGSFGCYKCSDRPVSCNSTSVLPRGRVSSSGLREAECGWILTGPLWPGRTSEHRLVSRPYG